MRYASIDELQETQAVEIAAREFSLADTLDVKTSIILAVIVFLATELERFFPSPVVGCAVALHYFSVTFLVLGAVFSAIELWPQNYGARRHQAATETI